MYQLISLYATIKHSVFATSVFHTSKQNFHVCLFVLFGSCYLWLLVTCQHFNASFTLIHNSFVSQFKTFHGLIKAKIFLFTSKNVWKQRYTLNCKFRDTCSKGLVKKHNCGALNLHNVQNKQLNWRMKVMLLSQKLFLLTYISKVEFLCRNQDICFFHFCHRNRQTRRQNISLICQVVSSLCYRNWDKLWPDEALGSYADLTFTYTNNCF